MDGEGILYIIGFILVSIYLVLGFDDFIWDLVTLSQRRDYRKQKLNLQKLNEKSPKLLALAIAAWHEDNVLGDVVSNIVASTNYPKSMYHIFLGVYPNDEPTIQVAQQLAADYNNVHVVINDTPGPTSKAQNINYVIRQIRKFEQEHQWKFASLTIHDSEDVVHPFELLVTNYLIEEKDALQFPVFPMMRMPKFRNFFSTITTGTYADEFAENHFSTMVSRYISRAFVPSAGTGFALSKKALESFGEEDVLPRDSLTEDYRLSLTLYQRGIQMYYVLEQVPRIRDNGKLVWDFITTRSIFPNTFKTAVRQKTRWILGITMQSFKLKDIFKTKGMPFVGRYSLYKDLKAKVGNLLVMVGYPILVYFIISLFVPLPAVYPKGTLSWDLSIIVTIMMVERQIFRGVAIYNVYGFRSVFFACLFPPVLPLRLIWGNIINMTATIRAYKQKTFGNQKKEKAKKVKLVNTKKKKLEWAKTDHEFIEQYVLKKYHRTIGDYLMQKGYVSPELLGESLKQAAEENKKIGEYLFEKKVITEEQLLEALAEVKHIPVVKFDNAEEYELHELAGQFDQDQLRQLAVLPLMKSDEGYVFAFCEDSPQNAQTILRNRYHIKIKAVFLSTNNVHQGLDIIFGKEGESVLNEQSMTEKLFKRGAINYEQVILARNYRQLHQQEEAKILEHMGLYNTLLPEEKVK